MTMNLKNRIQNLARHQADTDRNLLSALRVATPESKSLQTAVREFAHVLGAEETWLARLESRPSRLAVWPSGRTLDELDAEIIRLSESYGGYCDGLNDAQLSSDCRYTNSAGTSFSTPVADVLLHVFMHGMYHRGRINLLVRQAGGNPAPADYIAFVRGAAAATHTPSRA